MVSTGMVIRAYCSAVGFKRSQYASCVGCRIHSWNTLDAMPRYSSSCLKEAPNTNQRQKRQPQKRETPQNILSCDVRPATSVNHCIRYGANMLFRRGKSTPI